MSKAGEKMIAGAKEALAIVRGEQRMMCWACGSGVRAETGWRCDCTKMGTGTQRIVPIPKGG